MSVVGGVNDVERGRRTSFIGHHLLTCGIGKREVVGWRDRDRLR